MIFYFSKISIRDILYRIDKHFHNKFLQLNTILKER